MSSTLVGLVLDVVVMSFLVATIFYVMRLSKGLSDFKAHRRDFDGLITSLLSSIDQAERSVNSLKQASAQEAGDLSRLLKQSKAMSEELQIINEAGESMAKRLEKLAERNREIAQMSQSSVERGLHSKIGSPVPLKKKRKKDYKSTLKSVGQKDVHNLIVNDDSEADLPSFMIQDRDFADLNSLETRLDASASNDAQDDNENMPEHLQSQAERELYAALNAGRRKSSLKGDL